MLILYTVLVSLSMKLQKECLVFVKAELYSLCTEVSVSVSLLCANETFGALQ